MRELIKANRFLLDYLEAIKNGEKHKRVLVCPYCEENLNQIWINKYTIEKINNLVVCSKCSKIFKVNLIELKEVV